jgi:hypothetical protein
VDCSWSQQETDAFQQATVPVPLLDVLGKSGPLQRGGRLGGVPQVYVHLKGGVATKMPEDIIRSYLVNPFLYGGGSFCCGCNDYVSETELFWHETGQCLADYTRELQEGYLRAHGEPPPRPKAEE